jgi:hypothetical protein
MWWLNTPHRDAAGRSDWSNWAPDPDGVTDAVRLWPQMAVITLGADPQHLSSMSFASSATSTHGDSAAVTTLQEAMRRPEPEDPTRARGAAITVPDDRSTAVAITVALVSTCGFLLWEGPSSPHLAVTTF